MTIRTRIAPSPTGIAHIGTAYYAIYNYAFAKQHGGQFIIRIEDTDRQRFVEGAEEIIYEAIEWLGIPYDEAPNIGGPHAPYRQSERLPLYKKYAEELIEKEHAYYCFCSSETLETMRKNQQAKKELPRYDRRCRTITTAEAKKRVEAGERHVIRMKIPDNETVGWDDLVRGRIEFSSDVLDDQVILKSDGFPTYHLAVVVDDHEMQITHVMRGEEWISSGPKHVLLYRYLGWELPQFAHMPLLRNRDKSKMSKRKNDVSILSYRDKGYLSQALRNYLCLMGWSHPEEKDIFSMEEYVKVFSVERMQTTGPVFDLDKLNWINGKYIREVLSSSELETKLVQFLPQDFPVDLLPKVLPLIKDRLVTLADIESLTEFFYREIAVNAEDLVGKKSTPQEAKIFLEHAMDQLTKCAHWVAKEMEETLLQECDSKGWNRGAYFMSLRVAVTGRTATPPLFETIEILDKKTTLDRIRKAIQLLSEAL